MFLCLVMVCACFPLLAVAENGGAAPTVKIDLTTVLVAVINVIALVVARYLIPWIKERTTADQQEKMLAAVKTAVYAAEQMFGPGTGARKLEKVKDWLQKQGFDIDSGAVITAIEAAVQQLTLEQGKAFNVE